MEAGVHSSGGPGCQVNGGGAYHQPVYTETKAKFYASLNHYVKMYFCFTYGSDSNHLRTMPVVQNNIDPLERGRQLKADRIHQITAYIVLIYPGQRFIG